MKRVQRDLALTATTATLGMFLLWTGLRIGARATTVPLPAITLENILGLTAAGAGIAVLAWWVLGIILSFITGMLAHHGHPAAARLTGAMVPAPMKRLAIVVLGFNLIALPTATASQPSVPLAAEAELATMAIPGTTSTAIRPTPDSSPVSERADDSADHVSPQWTPTRALADGGLLIKQQRPVDRSGQARTETITVTTGDCLWVLAARQLGALATDADIAIQWQKWYALNASTIGSNPDVLQPGMLLLPPPPP